VLTAIDRGRTFVVAAGTVILGLSIVMWLLATYPKSDPPEAVGVLHGEAAALRWAGDEQGAARLEEQSRSLARQHALAHSVAGRLGRAIEPALVPLGFDWQIGVGVLTSFAAREVIVSTLAIIYGVGEEGESGSLYETLREARRTDGSLVFTPATCVSLLVFYVLALQCMSTVAVVRRETNSWRWPIAQFVAMGLLAYGASFVTYQILAWAGLA
jgi:ferrous iron transport protein B